MLIFRQILIEGFRSPIVGFRHRRISVKRLEAVINAVVVEEVPGSLQVRPPLPCPSDACRASTCALASNVTVANQLVVEHSVWERRLARQPAWSASTKHEVTLDRPRGAVIAGRAFGRFRVESNPINLSDVSSKSIFERSWRFWYNACCRWPLREFARKRESNLAFTTRIQLVSIRHRRIPPRQGSFGG
jgi:hypothetical protein